jgi:hypothetical protein
MRTELHGAIKASAGLADHDRVGHTKNRALMQKKERWITARNAQAMLARSSLSPTATPELHCASSEKTLFIVQQACKPQLTESTIFVFPPTLNKGKHMNRYI